MAVKREAGTKVHRLIASAVATEDVPDIAALSKAMWKLDPIGETIRSSVGVSCSTAASLYLMRLRPPTDWAFVGCEVRLAHAVADLVWCHEPTGDVLVEEIKCGAPGIGDDPVSDQVRRLHAGGIEKWGSKFLGVRLVELRAPARAAVWTCADGKLTSRTDDRLQVR